MKKIKIIPVLMMFILAFHLNPGQFKSKIRKKPIRIFSNAKGEISKPYKDEVLPIGSTYIIRWAVSGFNGKANIILKRGSQQVGIIAKNVNVGQQQYSWVVGKILSGQAPPGFPCYIELKDTGGKLKQIKNHPFMIKSKPVQFIQNSPPNTTVINAQNMMNNNKPDFVIRQVKTVPEPVYYGDNYQIRIWLEKYPNLPAPVKVHMQNINVMAPALLIYGNNYNSIPKIWLSHQPQLVYDISNNDKTDERHATDLSKELRKKVILKFDPHNQVDEKNENNNTQYHRFRILTRETKIPDLVFEGGENGTTWIRCNSTNYQKGVNEPVRCWVNVINQGTRPSGHFTIKIVGDDDRSKGTKFTKYVRLRRDIPANGKYQLVFKLTWKTPGMKVVNTFILDSNNEVKESNEDNNRSPKGLTARIK